MSHPTPVSRQDRIETLDVLRGFALLGILTMNIRGMAAPLSAYMYPAAVFEYSGASRLAYLFTNVVSDLKMMGLFSMLFGVSVLLYSVKLTASGQPPRGLWFRRMGWLLVIGLVHAYFIWGGDILVPYALCGILILWWARRLPAGALLAASIAALAIGAALTVAHGLGWEGMSEAERAQEAAIMMPTPEQAREHVGWMLGPYTETVANHAPIVFLFQTVIFLTFFLWRCSGMMLLGMALYKWGFLDGSRATRTYALTASLSLPIGLALCTYGALELDRVGFALPERIILDLWNYTGAIFVSIGYAALIILAVKHGALSGLRRVPRRRRADGADQLPPPQHRRVRALPGLGIRPGWTVRLCGATGGRRHDLGGPACSEPGMARALPLRTGRVAVAVAHVLAATTAAA